MPLIDDPVERFVSVVKFYLSGWHIKPPGVKKPLNPILGEVFTCYWDYPDKTRGYYISEQTSHHPPKSSYFFMIPEHNIRIDGTLKPRSKFLGNSAASLMEGIAVLSFVTQPNMYARGILFGKMKYELGDHSFVKCPEQYLAADIEFKTKGYFGGTYNAIGGTIKNEKTGETLYELHGTWNGEMTIKNVMTGHKEVLFDATGAKHTPPTARPIQEQTTRESQKLWLNTTTAIINSDHNAATDEKTKIEDMQREEAAQRQQQGIEWRPKLFRAVRGGPGGSEEGEEALDWILDTEIDGQTPEQKTQQILAIAPVLPGQKSNEHTETQPSVKAPGSDRSQPPAEAAGDLIDFGGADPAQVKPQVQAEEQSPVAAVQHPGHASQSANLLGLDDAASSSDAHPTVKRLDTETNEVDEFMDARS
ncbi:MAG: hypothetical protein MMC23_003425 [Stictis urceolatum]|nr:hypothetical protein [Stictis urceolata]